MSFVPSDGNKPSKPRGTPKGVKNKVRGVKIKVQSPGSASVGAGAILKRLRNLKIVGKGRSRSESSPIVSNGIKDSGFADRNVSKNKSCCINSENDGSFIKNHFEISKAVVNDHSNMEVKDGDGIGFVDPYVVSNGTSKLDMADVEHIEVESTRKASKDGLDYGSNDSAFVFGKVQSNKGILKKPSVGLTSVQFGPSLFYKPSNVWSANKVGINAWKSDGSLNIESFTEKMKKGVEDRELLMNFAPQCVSKNSDGSKRIDISMDMDYRVFNANLSRMWRVYGISDITKT
ncbi:hypothetical protein Tco_1441951, partial [Tanacetum coccineum]